MKLFLAFTFTLCISLGIEATTSIFKCSPVDGAFDTYSFSDGSDMGIACVKGNQQQGITFYIERMSVSGSKRVAIGTLSPNSNNRKLSGFLYRLYPPGPKHKISAKFQVGHLKLIFNKKKKLSLELKPDGLPWIPFDSRLISGCAMDTPQLFMSVYHPKLSTSSRLMMCALSSGIGSGYNSIYAFGLKPSRSSGWQPVFFIGQASQNFNLIGQLNMMMNLNEICLKPDCHQCHRGYRSLTLSS